MGLLLCAVNTLLLVVIARHSGASLVPDSLAHLACALPSRAGGAGGAGRAPPADGFSTSVSGDGKYEAPAY